MDEQKAKVKHFSIGEEIIFFLIPLVGIIVYFINTAREPEKARYALGISITGLVLGAVLSMMFVL
jgi:hypothetical protein